jgi:hypothetical protein
MTNVGPDDGGNTMTRAGLGQLTALEGRQVSLALRSGDRIDDAQLVSARRNRAGTLWLFTNGSDRFVAVEDVIDVWEAHPAGPPLAA